MQQHSGQATAFRTIMPALVAAAALVLAACGPDGAGSGGGNATLTVTGTDGSAAASSPAQATPLAVDLSSGVTLDAFSVSVREVELEQELGMERESEIEFEGPFVIDLLDPAGLTIVGDIPPDTYHEVELKLMPAAGLDPANPGDELALFVSGSYTSSLPTVTEPFAFTISIVLPPGGDLEIEAGGPNGITIDGPTNDLVVAFRLDQAFTPANLDALIEGMQTAEFPGLSLTADRADITFDLSDQELSSLTDRIEDALDFGEDYDGDHDLDDDEDVDDDRPSL